MVSSPSRGTVAPGFTGQLRRARGGRPRTGLIVPAAGLCGGRGAGLAPLLPVRGPLMGPSLAGPSGFGLGLHALRPFAVCEPGHSRVRFPVASVFQRETWLVHWGCFVWTPIPPLSGRRTPRPGPACVCLCVLFLPESGETASRARFGAPHLSFGHLSFFFVGPPPGCGCPWLDFFFPGSPVSPLPVSPRAPAVSSVLCFRALGALGFCALRLLLHPPPFSLFFSDFFLCLPFFLLPVLHFPRCSALRPFSPWLWRCPVSGRGCPRLWCCAVCATPPPFFSPAPPPPCPLCLGVLARAVARRCALCSVCPWVSCCASRALSPLCGAALRCGGRCARVVLFIWSVPFLVPRALGRSCVLRCFLWCSAVWCCATLLGACCAVLLHAVPCSPALCRVVRRRLLCAAVLCCAGAPVSCSSVVRSSAVLLLPACLRFSPLAPSPPGVRAVPCAVCCRLALLPFCLVFCGAVLPCSVLRVVVSCPALLCCGLLCAGLAVRLPCLRCVLLCVAVCCDSGCSAAPRCSTLCCAVVCCAVLLRPFGAAACCVVPLGDVRRSGVLRFPALCFLVFPRAVCSVLCVCCPAVVVCAVVALCCGCSGRSCCVSPVLHALGGAVLRCAGVLALCRSCGLRCFRRCFRRLVLWCVAVCCAVACGVLWRGAGSGCPWSSSGAVFRVGVPVWPHGLLPCGWCGLLRCSAPLCCVLWCCAAVWCCAVVFCCVFAALFVFAVCFLFVKPLQNPWRSGRCHVTWDIPT